MAIFNKGYGSTTTTINESAYDCENGGLFRIISESYEDDIALYEEMADVDLTEIETDKKIKEIESEADPDTGAVETLKKDLEDVQEASLKEIWGTIKTKFKEFIEKLKAWFASVIRVFDGIFMNSKKFVEKYEKEILALNLSGYKVEMFEYSHINNVSMIKAVKNKLDTRIDNIVAFAKKKVDDYIKSNHDNGDNDSFIDGTEKNKEKITKDIMNDLNIDGFSKGDYTDISTASYKYFRNGANGPVDKKMVSVDAKKLINFCKSGQEKINILKEIISSLSRQQGKVESMINSAVSEDGRALQVTKYYIQEAKAVYGVHMSFYGAYKNAVSEALGVYTGALKKAFGYSKKQNKNS